jgi:LPS-assembly lipoprotein
MGNAYSSVGLDSAGRFDIEPSLRRALSQTGVPLVSTDPELVLELINADEELRTASVSGNARTAEYELIARVRYAIRDASGSYLTKPTTLQSSRRYFLDRGNLVGSNEEQALLRRELRTDLVQQIMRVLNTVSRTPGSPSIENKAKKAGG